MHTPRHPLGFVLIHGGGLERWVWERLTPLLELPAVAAQRLPPGADCNRLTISDCARYIQQQADTAGFERSILVGHSIGGVLAPAVATLAPARVAHMVFLGANIPPNGQSAVSRFSGSERLLVWLGAILAGWGIKPRRATEQYIRERVCNDLDEASTRQAVEGGLHPEPPALLLERVARGDLSRIPCTYVKLLRDRALAPEVQERMAIQIGARVQTLDTGHLPMLARPAELAAILNGVAAAAGTAASQPQAAR